MITREELIDYAKVKHNMTYEQASESVDSYLEWKSKSIKSSAEVQRICANCIYVNECRFSNENLQGKCKYFISKFG